MNLKLELSGFNCSNAVCKAIRTRDLWSSEIANKVSAGDVPQADVARVQELIERCMHAYLSFEDTVRVLAQQHQVSPSSNGALNYNGI